MTIIHVWFDDGIIPNQWAVSLCDDDGTESRCLHGFEDRAEAISWGEHEADLRGIAMEVLHQRTGEVVARYQPGDDDIDVDLDGALPPRVLYGADHDHDDVERELPAGWEVDWSSAHRISAPLTTPVRYAAALVDVASKRDVLSWDHAATFVATYDDADECGDWRHGACDVRVEIGRAGARWYIRTRDDANGSDECGDTAYSSEDAALAAAQEYADDHHEADPGERAADYVERMRAEVSA